jgi:inner membrane protein
MMGRSHLPSGAAAWLPIGAAMGLSVPVNIGLAAVAAVAALAPDMDHPHASLPRAFPGGRFLAGRISDATGGHRHGTHTLVAAVLVSTLTWWTAYVLTSLSDVHSAALAASVGIGYLAHLAGDVLTLSGVPLLLPFSKRLFRLRLFRTGSLVETLLVSPAFGLAVVLEVWALTESTVTPYVEILRAVLLT